MSDLLGVRVTPSDDSGQPAHGTKGTAYPSSMGKAVNPNTGGNQIISARPKEVTPELIVEPVVNKQEAVPNKVPATAANTAGFDDTVRLQERLNSSGADLIVDGIDGPLTKAAMAQYMPTDDVNMDDLPIITDKQMGVSTDQGQDDPDYSGLSASPVVPTEVPSNAIVVDDSNADLVKAIETGRPDVDNGNTRLNLPAPVVNEEEVYKELADEDTATFEPVPFMDRFTADRDRIDRDSGLALQHGYPYTGEAYNEDAPNKTDVVTQDMPPPLQEPTTKPNPELLAQEPSMNPFDELGETLQQDADARATEESDDVTLIKQLLELQTIGDVPGINKILASISPEQAAAMVKQLDAVDENSEQRDSLSNMDLGVN